MLSIPILKYTTCGNNFVIVDETENAILTEAEKNYFAYQATNINFGVGADNFLVLQPCTKKILTQINTHRKYWKAIPDPSAADYVFRMFESDGKEAYSCGNGLMSIANHLFESYRVKQTRILTEVPTSTPRVVTIGTEESKKASWVMMAPPRRIPESMAEPSIREKINAGIDGVYNIELKKIRRSDALRFFHNHTSLSLSGYLVFTGEPHLVIFSDDGLDIPNLANQIFFTSSFKEASFDVIEKRTASSQAFVDFIGKYFVREFSHFFPVGININFVRISADGNSMEHRCFERGINHETLACGTGALASAFIAMELRKVKSGKIAVHPHCCRWYLPDAEITVENINGDWRIMGNPAKLLNGTFSWRRSNMRCHPQLGSHVFLDSAAGEPSTVGVVVQ